MVFTPTNLSRLDREWHKFVGATGTGSEVSVSVVIASGNITIGSVSATVDSIYVQSGITNIVDSNDAVIDTFGPVAVGSQTTGSTTPIGAETTSTTPTEVGTGSIANLWTDTFGRQVIKGTNLSQEALDVNEIAPALIQTINVTNLNAVGSATGSNVGAWVNMSDYVNKTIYYDFTSGATGSIHVTLEASHDAGSTAFEITAGSLYFESDTLSYITNTEHHEYLRARTDFNEGGTLTVTFAGRGGQ